MPVYYWSTSSKKLETTSFVGNSAEKITDNKVAINDKKDKNQTIVTFKDSIDDLT